MTTILVLAALGAIWAFKLGLVCLLIGFAYRGLEWLIKW